MSYVWDNAVLICYCCLWFFTLLRLKRKSIGFGACLFVISSYFFYSIISIVLYNSALGYKYIGLQLFPLMYLYLMLIISLIPAIKYECNCIMNIQMPTMTFLYTFMLFYSVCAFMSLPREISDIRYSINMIINNADYGAELYNNLLRNSGSSDHSISGIIGLMNIFHTYFKDVNVFIFFYYLSLKNRIKLMSIYQTAVLLADLLISIASGGRTEFIMLLIIIIIAYFMFHEYWDARLRRIIRICFTFGLIGIMIPFFALTISRFGTRYGGSLTSNTLISIVSYLGQENLNFSKYIFKANGIRYGDRTINEFKRLMQFDVPNGFVAVRSKYRYMNINDSIFYTFVGDFVLDFGPIISFIVFSVFSFVFTLSTNPNYDAENNRYIAFHKLLLVYFALCICGQGGMYLFYYSFSRNWVIVAFFVMYIALRLDYSRQKGKYMYLMRESIIEEKSKKRRVRFIINRKR